jgi:hypothetical protein
LKDKIAKSRIIATDAINIFDIEKSIAAAQILRI